MIGEFCRCASGVRFGRKHTPEEKQEEQQKSVTIRQYTLGGELVMEHDTVEAAAAAVGGTVRNIENVLDGTFKSSKGFIWQYSDDDQIESIVQIREDRKLPTPEMCSHKRQRKPVEQYSLDGELVTIWDSMAEAAAVLGITKRGIRASATDGSKPYKGFMWRYLNETDMQSSSGWKIGNEEIAKILEMYDKGYSKMAISDALGISYPTIRKYIAMEERLAKRV